MTTTTAYDHAFYNKIQEGALQSAKEIVPWLIDWIQPKSVVDIGCGRGAWLTAFLHQGVGDILGVDGDYVNPSTLLIPAHRFKAANVGEPLNLGRHFDLVISLEVGEHLPAANAQAYVNNLTSLGKVIAFSAAVPNQGGTGHVNEQWPDYWKALFEARDFILLDCVRPHIWENRNVEFWYRQNLVLYVHRDYLATNSVLKKEAEKSQNRMLSLVHPAMYCAPSLSAIAHMLPKSLARAFHRRLGKH